VLTEAHADSAEQYGELIDGGHGEIIRLVGLQYIKLEQILTVDLWNV